MASEELTQWTVAEAARQLAAGHVSSTELTEAYLARIERLQPKLNAYTTVTADRARADARLATDEIARGGSRGPLHGVPIALKDLCETQGIRTTAGSAFFADHVPTEDCTVARCFRDEGAVLLGKAATHEFAYGVTTDNPHFGATRNPWDPSCIPGGSSGGSGAAIAGCLAATTIGTDTGGSIRIPSSLCGATGLKATYGRVSKAGIFPLAYLFDHAGPIAHSAEDAAIVLEAIAGYDPADATTARTPVDRYREALGRGVRGMRIGVPRAYFYDRLDGEVATAVEKALGTLRDLGAEVRDVDVPSSEPAIMPVFGAILAEAQHIHKERLKTPEKFGADVRAILEQPSPSAADLTHALEEMRKLTSAFRFVLESVDALVTPTTPIPAAKIGQDTARYGGAEEPVIFAMIRCTAPFNATGLPALSLPCGLTQGNLPIGLQLIGRPFDESTLLAAGHAYQGATDWHRRRPKL